MKGIDTPYRRQWINVVLQAMDKAWPGSEPKLTVDGRTTEIRLHDYHGAAAMFGKPNGEVESGRSLAFARERTGDEQALHFSCSPKRLQINPKHPVPICSDAVWST